MMGSVSAAVAFAVLIAPAVPSAAPPPGLAYDEIVRGVLCATSRDGQSPEDLLGRDLLHGPGV